MLVKTRGIVFKSIKYKETSIIADIYTEQLGLRSYIINGVRKAKARTHASLFQITSLVDMVVYEKEQKNLNRIKEIKRAYVYQAIPYQVIKSAMAQFMLEVTRKVIKQKEENQELFAFIFNSFKSLDDLAGNPNHFHIKYLLALSSFLGLKPEPTDLASPYYFDIEEGLFQSSFNQKLYQLNEKVSNDLNIFLQDLIPNQMDGRSRQQLIAGILNYLKYHIEDFGDIHAHEILSTVLH